MKKLLNTKMTWLRVIIFAVATGVITALLNCIPGLQRTSFTAPAETLEIWVPFALYIIMNCKGYKEAMLKTFVFFLISQPLIYLVEVPFNERGWELFQYYPFWGIITVLTIPGAALAYRVKKGDAISAVILSIANLLMITLGLSRINNVIFEFPRYLITLIFCLGCPVIFIIYLLKNKRSRIIAIILGIVALIIGLCMFVFFPGDSSTSFSLEEGSWSGVLVSEKGLTANIEESGSMALESHKNGEYTVTVIGEDGKKICYDVTVKGANHYITVGEPYYSE